MSDTPGTDRVAYYSILRFVPDPLRDEPINVGLFAVSDDGQWARFEAKAPRTRLAAIRCRDDAERIEEWAASLKERFDLGGHRGLFDDRGRISREVLDEWSRSFSAALRVTEPRVGVDPDLDTLWSDLFSRLVRTPARERTMVAANRQVTAAAERKQVVQAFVSTAQKWPTFDEGRLRYGLPFRGKKASHYADLAILNGHVTGVMQGLPLASGDEREIVSTRAMLIDAAVDLDKAVVKLALYRDPPSHRADLLLQSRSVLREARQGIRVVSTREFPRLESELANTLFPP